ncbi:MSHA biogenesis protein MshI [Shewanella pneumatophori]|uniref:MSHA biogenesis protein MshI n=1 Tax=Shewanella pneumatophori TaxID=314092 RepID=A0A9X1ZK65_9GAMM|nr:MSHA biogenesis protein MshI [Shewanella pneumatophori]MCL1139303.1 MSHA biogenesis protein MshI [Shewanella pneumatophori]
MEESLLGKIQFWRKSAPKQNLGVYICADKISVFQGSTAQVAAKTMTFAFNQHDWNSAFSQVVKEFGVANIQIVLAADFYQLLLVDKPNVQEEELNAALLWSVKDIVTQAVTDIHLDYFESSKQTTNKVNVVVTEKSQLSALLIAAKNVGLVTVGVSIEEMAMSNLFDDNQARLVLSHREGQELLLTVVRAGEVFMQRRVRGFLQIDKVSAEDLSYGVADNLSLELQRSMDYFESQLREAPVSSIELVMDGERVALANLIAANFDQSVTPYDGISVESVFAQLALAEITRGQQQ